MLAITVADNILKTAKKQNKALTPMALVKLTYIAYGWHMAFTNQKLFEDKIEAWQYGPMIPTLYEATRSHGKNVIPFDEISDAPITNQKMEAFYNGLVTNYATFSDIALSNLTHQEGTPWKQTYTPNALFNRIPDDLIKTYYLSQLKISQAA